MSFDDIETTNGFGYITRPYKGFVFNDFYAFKPSHPKFTGVISSYDLNCAVSKPNALYGAACASAAVSQRGHMVPQGKRPSVCSDNSTKTFTVHALKIKPLDLPVGSATINLQGLRSNNPEATLSWGVDFPAGYHDVLYVRVEEFTGEIWNGLTRLEIWADFHFDNIRMDDWEFCVDDIELELDSLARL
ncbi:hypothetical protein AYL99_10206 [Fonsecaea erecta]|uniref:Uncharacterized protein n=1 Tax=Fonsecaea erecta TaxID=1367422 RepID=A0A178Z7T1_9EURO|nr:hypothetical protein AYL99_10206 [Fonsecaea erecta]OAP55233.1 hypothetical protein AYL99_10206 [Fonsecaea erecta]